MKSTPVCDTNTRDVMSTFISEPDSLKMDALSVVLIGPEEEQRRAIRRALAGPQGKVAREFSNYPDVDELAELTAGDYDVIIVHLDPDPERALDVVETLCSHGSSITVIVHSAQPNPELLLRCMRAGAREFLTDPLLPNVIGEALVRASVRRDEVHRKKAPAGKLLVFAGAKGGTGVTTVASNFAAALARYAKVALIDLDLELGDAALTLGLSTHFTTLDALNNLARLDSEFLLSLMAKHDSGLSVLGAPDTIPTNHPPKDATGRLLRLAREDFAYVVVDAGSHSLDWHEELFQAATTVYLVTQVSVPDLRNANRFVTRYFSGFNRDKLEIVLNRHVTRNVEIDETAVTKALTQPVKWKLPNDYAAARRAQNTGVAVALDKSQLAQALARMAHAVCGEEPGKRKKKKFGLF
jgi:pilus assembly protein CpaE